WATRSSKSTSTSGTSPSWSRSGAVLSRPLRSPEPALLALDSVLHFRYCPSPLRRTFRVAHTISALRQHKQSEIRRARNHAVKSELRTQMKKVLGAVEKKDAAGSKAALS